MKLKKTWYIYVRGGEGEGRILLCKGNGGCMDLMHCNDGFTLAPQDNLIVFINMEE